MPKAPKAAAASNEDAPPAPPTTPQDESSASDATPETAAGNNNGSNPLDDVGEVMPTVQQHAVDAHRADAQASGEQAPAASSGVVDSQGRTFDPALHEHDDGKPRLTASGKLRCWRGGRSSAQTASKSRIGGAKQDSKVPGSTPGPSPAEREAQIQSTAAVTAQLIFVVGQAVGGEEWSPRKKDGLDENSMMQGAWAEYYRAHGVTDLPPWAGLAVAMGAYVGPRLFMPKTQTRLGKAKEWLYGHIGRWRARRSSARREANDRRAVEEALS